MALLMPAAGCATDSASRRPDGDWPTAAARALAAWAAFPVGAESRPIVLITAEDSKIPFGPAHRTEAGHLPTGPAQFAGYPVISARQALDRLLASGDPWIQTLGGPAAAKVTGARLASAKFQTDRGPMTLPTWLFTVSRVPSPLQVSALAPGARYTFPNEAGAGSPVQVAAQAPDIWPGEEGADMAAGGNGVRISPDGRELTFSVYYQPDPGDTPCGQGPSDTRVELVESTHAVAYRTVLTALPRSRPPRPPNSVCPAIVGFGIKPVTLRLAAPLGDRVLIKVINPPNR
jgi:hypothetical protein